MGACDTRFASTGSDIQSQIASLQGHYNGIAINVQKRAGNVNLTSSYTWSHKLDNWAASGTGHSPCSQPSGDRLTPVGLESVQKSECITDINELLAVQGSEARVLPAPARPW
jgi:hypothetical protein